MNDNGSKSLLAMAIEREDWELAALCLLYGVVKAAENTPRETLDALLDELAFEDEPAFRIRRQRKGEGRMVTSDRWSEPVRAKRALRRSPQNFYRDSLSETEQIQLKDAANVESLGDEIATFRVRLKTALKEHPEDFRLLERGIAILVRAVSAQYRLSPKAKDDLADSLAAVFNSLGDHILPPDQ